MKVFAVFLVIIYSSIAHSAQECETDWPTMSGECMHRPNEDCNQWRVHPEALGVRYGPSGNDWCIGDDMRCCINKPSCMHKGGVCKPAPCGPEDKDITGSIPDLCPPVTLPTVTLKCCVAYLCKDKHHGECIAAGSSCDGEEIHYDFASTLLCPAGKPKCCVKKEDTPCHEQLDGICKHDCGSNRVAIGDHSATADCLCPSSLAKKCCVKKDDEDLCEALKGGKCKSGTFPCTSGEKQPQDALCANAGDTCCVPDQPCEEKNTNTPPMGICIKKFCPLGYKTAEELCKTKPPDVHQWCFDDEDVCCVPII